MSSVLCEVCSGTSNHWLSAHGYDFYRCQRCGYMFIPLEAPSDFVESVFGDAYFSQGGAGYPDYLADRQLLVEHAARYADVVQRYIPKGTLLDVGAAGGFLLQQFIDRGWSGIAIEPNASMARYASSDLGLRVELGALEDYSPTETVDLVTMIQVVMHFYDLRRALDVAAACTKPGGYWLIEAPNGDSLTARVLGKYWQEYSPPSVRRIFSPRNLQALVAEYGFTFVALGRPRKIISGAHAKSFLKYKAQAYEGAPSRMLDVAAGLVPPELRIPHHAEDLFWALYRKEDHLKSARSNHPTGP